MIEFKDVTVIYDMDVIGLDNVSFTINDGEFVFLVGKTGAGKSSAIKLLTGEIKPTAGDVVVDGIIVNSLRRSKVPYLRRAQGVVFQDFRLLDHLSAFDNVALPLRVCGMEEREVRKRVKELLQWVELDRHILDTPATLSGGEKQRIAIARAVINRPELLLADEPTGNVDNDIAPKLMKLFVELNKLGTTVVIATHSEKLINDFSYPRLHLQNHGLHILYPGNSRFGGQI